MAVRRSMLAACGLLAIPLLYIPFRLVAQTYNIALTAFVDRSRNVEQVDNFAYPFAIFIWPAFAILCGSLVPYIAKRVGASWPIIVPPGGSGICLYLSYAMD